MLSTESSIYDLGNVLKLSGIRESCGNLGWHGWPGGAEGEKVMEAGGGVRTDSGESLCEPQGTPLFQLYKVERGTPGPLVS